MTSETDAEFVADMEWLHSHDREAALPPEKLARLFALARRGAGLTLDRQRLVAYPDGSEWVEEIYSRFMPLPPPPAGETND